MSSLVFNDLLVCVAIDILVVGVGFRVFAGAAHVRGGVGNLVTGDTVVFMFFISGFD